MQYEKPLIFIYPISDTLMNLKKAIEASGQPLDIYEIDDLRELLQTVPALGQSLVLGSNAKKCAKFLQAAKKLIKQYDTKVVIISQKQYPRKTVDKLMKFGLNDIIFEPVPAKTLMHKVNLMLRSLKVPSKQELEKKFKAEQAQKEQEDSDELELKDGEGRSKNSDDPDADESSYEMDREESEEEMLNSLSNQSIKRDSDQNEDSQDSFDARDVDAGNSEYEKRMAELESGETEEDEESLLASMQEQKISPPQEDLDNSFDSSSIDAGNSEMSTEKIMVEEGGYEEEVDEEALLSDMPSSENLKKEEQDSNFDASKMDVPAQEQAQDKDFRMEAQQASATQEDDAEFDPFAAENEADDEETISLADLANTRSEESEETVSLDDLASTPDESATNVDGESESYTTHMEGQGNTEHLQDDEHQMSESEMEFEEMAALSEISNMSTKMKGEASADAAIDDNMMGDVHQQDKVDNTMMGDIYAQDEIDGNMQGDLYGEDSIDSNMVGDVNLDDLMEGGNLEGDVLSQLEEDADLTGEIHSKEKNIKTHYDGEGINHQDQYEPNLEHSADNQELGGHLEGDVYDSSNELDDDMANLMADDVDLSDLTGDSGVEELGGNLEGDIYNTTENPDGDFEGLISDDPEAERLKGRAGTDQIQENDLEGANNSLMADQGGNMGGHQDGTEHIETHYNTDFANQLEKKKKQNPLMEFDHQEDFYGQTEFAKAKKKSALEMHQSEDLYEQGHTRSLQEDKDKRATDDWSDQQKADTGFNEFDENAKKNPKLEMPYELHEVQYDDEGNPIAPMQEFDEQGRPKNPQLQMQYEMESDWSKKSDGKLKAQYSLEELDEIDKKRAPLKVPKMSIEEQYAVYDDVALDSLIEEFGSDEEVGDEQLQELKDMADSLRGTIYDDYEPEDVTKLENFDPWDEDFRPSEKERPPLADPVDPEDALGLDTLIAISQLHQMVTMRPKDAIYQGNKMLWQEHQCLACIFHIENTEVTELYNAITDPIVSNEYLEPEAWNAIKTRLLQSHKKTGAALWEGPDEEGMPKLYFRPYYEDNIYFGGIILYFHKNIELQKRGLFEAYAETFKMMTYSALPANHSLLIKQQQAENPSEKETLVGRMKGFYQETFVEEQVDAQTGEKGSKFGNWLKKKIEKIAS